MSAFTPGMPIIWHYESHRGWGISWDVPGVVIRSTAKRVLIEVLERPRGGDWQRVTRRVTPEKLSVDPENQYARLLATRNIAGCEVRS